MPNIPVYTADQNALAIRTSDRAIESTAQSGRRISQAYDAAGAEYSQLGRRLGSAVEYATNVAAKLEEHREISQGAAVLARLQADATRGWNEVAKTADPNDASVAGRYNDEVVEPAIGEFRDAFRTEGGRKWAESRVDAFRQHMFTKTQADMSTMAGLAIKNNIHATINSLSNSVKGDPSSLDFSLDTLKASVEGLTNSSVNLSATDAAKFREELMQHGGEAIVKSALFGAIQQNPQAGVALASDPRYSRYVPGTEVKQMETFARQTIRMEQAEARNAAMWAKQQAQDRSDKTIGDMLVNMWGANPSVTKDNIIDAYKDGNLTRQGFEHAMALYEKANKEDTPARVSAATTQSLMSAITSTDPRLRLDSTDRITKALVDGQLTRGDYTFLMNEYAKSRTPEGENLAQRTEQFLKAVEPQIDKSMLGNIDQAGREAMYRFRIDLTRKINEYRKEGKDPYTLLDPASPDYMGKAVRGYQTPLQQRMQGTADRVQGPRPMVPPRSVDNSRPTNATPPMPGAYRDGGNWVVDMRQPDGSVKKFKVVP